MTNETGQASIGKSSFLLGSGTFVSRILGFVRMMLLALVLGIVGSVGADTFAVANQLPNNLHVLIAGGVVAATLVPAIVRSAMHADGGSAYINKLLTLALIAFTTITVIATLLAPALVTLYAAEWSPSQLALATAFAYWCLPQLFFYGLYTVLGEVLNARGVFGPFTWAPVLNNIVGIAGIIAFALLFGVQGSEVRLVVDWTPEMIALLAGTATAGVAAQALILLVSWRKLGLRYRPDFAWKGVGLADTGKMVGWTFGLLVMTQLGGIVQTNVVALASGSGASVFTMNTAWLIFMLPHSLIAVSMGTVYFTRMSAAASQGPSQELAQLTSQALRQIGLLLVWSAAALFAVALPISGLFTTDPGSKAALGSLIMILAFGLPAFTAMYVMFRVFLTLGQARTLFAANAFQVGLFVIIAFLATLLPVEQIAAGVSFALACSTVIAAVVTFFVLKTRLPELELRPIVMTNVRSYIAGAIAALFGIMAAALLGVFSPAGFAGTNFLTNIVAGIAIALVVTIFYVVALYFMKTRELADVITLVRSRLGR